MTPFLTIALFCIVLLLTYFVAMVVVLKKHFNITWQEIFVEIALKRTAGTYLFYCSFIYFWVGMYSVFVDPIPRFELVQIGWLVVCSLPLWIPPLARFLNMRVLWK